jgi:hypothetical protein
VDNVISRPRPGTRSAALFVLGTILVLSGLGNINHPPTGPAAANQAVAVHLLGGFSHLLALWIAVGVFAFVGTWWNRLQIWAYPAVAGLFCFLAVTSMWAWLTVPGATRAWFAAITWLGFCAMTLFASGLEGTTRDER